MSLCTRYLRLSISLSFFFLPTNLYKQSIAVTALPNIPQWPDLPSRNLCFPSINSYLKIDIHTFLMPYAARREVLKYSSSL